MFSKIVLTILALALSSLSFGATEPTQPTKAKTVTTSNPFLDAVKAVNKYQKETMDLYYHGEFYLKHHSPDDPSVDHDLRDFSTLQMPTFIYKFKKNWKFSGLGEFKYSDYEAPGFPNRFYRGLFTITHENILKEKENGVKLDIGIGRRVFDRKSVPGTFGNTRLVTTWSKTFNPQLSGNMLAQYLYNDPKNTSAATWKHGVEMVPSFSYTINDKFSFSFQDDINLNTPWKNDTLRSYAITHEAYSTLTYKHSDKINPYFQFHYLHGDDYTSAAGYKTDSLDYFLGCGFTIGQKLNITPEIGHLLFTDSDHRMFVEMLDEMLKTPDLAIYVDYSF